MNKSIEFIKEKINCADKIVVISHKNPDGDAVGSVSALALALVKLGKEVCILLPDPVIPRLAFILKGQKYYLPDDKLPFEADLVITLDCAASTRLGALSDKFVDKVDISIDHHAVGEEFAKFTYTVSDASATCEILCDVIDALDCGICKETAYPLYAGIVSDSGNFKYSNTSAKTLCTAARLLEYNIDNAEISRLLFDTASLAKLKADAYATEKLNVFANGRAAMVCIERDEFAKSGLSRDDFDDAVNIPRKLEGVEIGVYLRGAIEEGEYRVSLRSNSYADVAAISVKYGGGGHVRAAGCTIKAESINIASEMIMRDIEGELNSGGEKQ